MHPVEKALIVSTTTGSIAKGLMFSISSLYFTQVVGLRPAVVGAGLTVAGVAGMAASLAAGYLADRFGARRILLGATLAQGAALAAYGICRGMTAFLLVACVAVGAQGAQRTAQVTLLARAFQGAERANARARLRVATNVFVAVGSAAAAGPLTLGTKLAYEAAMLAAAALVLCSLLALRTLPVVVVVARLASLGPPLRDRRYLAVAALNGVITIQFGVLTVGLPLWVTGHTRAPAATVALLLVLNTALVALGQVRFTRRITDVRSAGRAVFRAVVLLLTACLLYAAAASGNAAAAACVLVPAVVAHSFGEILSEAGGWQLAFDLADPRDAGAYQGISQTGFALGTALAPATVTATAITHGTPGWIVLGALFLAAGAATAGIASRVTPALSAGQECTPAADSRPDGRAAPSPTTA
ncbi:MAG TPA: MFS transporter [Actinoplanes sp.]